MSTVSPRASRELAERVRARGAAMLDAPVSGSVPQVQAGTLTIMVGGDEQAYARVEPILRELGTPTHIGENGQGLVLKLAINISLAVQMLAFAEGLVLAERAGIDRKLAVDVMTESPIGSPMLKARADLVLDLPDEAWFDVRLMQKDVALALDTGRELRVPLPSAAAADTVLTVARASGYERRDIAALFEVLHTWRERPDTLARVTVEGSPGTMSVWSEAVGTVWPRRDARDGPLPPLLLLLTVVTGLVDAASYLKLGHVFVANMTGNVVFLGFAIAGASGLSIWASLVALGSFLLGGLAGGRIGNRFAAHRGQLLRTALATQVLFVAAAVSLAAATGDPRAARRRPLATLTVTAIAAQRLWKSHAGWSRNVGSSLHAK